MSNIADIRDYAAEPRKEGQNALGFSQIVEILWRRRRMGLVIFVILAAAALLAIKNREPVYTATTTIMVDAAGAGAPAGLEGVPGYGLGIDVIESQIEILKSYALALRVVENLDLANHPEYALPSDAGRGAPEADALRQGATAEDGGGGTLTALGGFGDWLGGLRESLGLGGAAPQSMPAGETGEAAASTDAEQVAADSADAPTGEGGATEALDAAETGEAAAVPVETPESNLAKRLARNVDVEQVGKSSVIRISYSTNVPDLSQQIANAYAELYITQQLNAKLQAAEQASGWFAEQLERLRRETEAAESTLDEFRRENMLVEGMDETSLRQQIGEINSEIIAVRSTLEGARAALTNMQAFLERGDTIAGDSVDSPVVTELRQQLASLRQQRSELASQYASGHPVMQNMDAEIAGLMSELRVEVRSYAGTLQNDVTAGENRLAALREELNSLNDDLQQVLSASGELRVLEREAAAKRTMYDNLLSRAQEAQSFTVNRPDVWTVSEAVAPSNPDAPSKTMLAAAAILLAAGAAGFSVLFAELMESGYRSESEVENTLGLSVIGNLPLVRGGQRRVLREAERQPDGDFATEIRRIHATIQHRCARRGVGSVVALTSALEGEGVSSLTLTMARDLAATGLKVAVIDGDAKNARVTDLTGGSRNRTGLSDVLAGTAAGEDVRYKDRHSEVRVIPVGKARAGALNVASLAKLEDLMKDLRVDFDAVLVDTPPLGRSTDARFLARIVDAMVMVVEWRRTPRSKVGRAVDLLTGRPDMPIMVALNKVRPRLVPQTTTATQRSADRAAA